MATAWTGIASDGTESGNEERGTPTATGRRGTGNGRAVSAVGGARGTTTGVQPRGLPAVDGLEGLSGRPRRRDWRSGAAVPPTRRGGVHRNRPETNLHPWGGFPIRNPLQLRNPEGPGRVVVLRLRGLHDPTQLTGMLTVEGGLDGILPIGLHRPLHQHGAPRHRLEAEPLEPERPAEQADDQGPVEARHLTPKR